MIQGCIQNQAVAPVIHYTLGRIEHLRRYVLKPLANIERRSGAGDAAGMTRGLP